MSASPFATAEVWKSTFHTDFRADLRRLTVPTLIVHGVADQSALIDVTGRRTRELVPHAVYREYPTAGHGLYVTHAEQLNAEILEFVKS
jgi:pimeloyl-ACP methyl ester carboxylesterase